MNGARFACAAMVAAACTATGVGLHAQAARQDRPKRRDPRLASLVLEAESVSNEFASDALLRLAGSGLIDDPEWRRDLLETAYMRAYAAQQSYRRMTAGIPPETRQGAAAMAAESTLNRVSLQVRATELLARDYPDRARELFEWIELNIERRPAPIRSSRRPTTTTRP